MRRRLVLGAPAVVAGCLGGWRTGAALAAGPAGPAGAGCEPTPDFATGPFYVKQELLREDITEGLPGVPLLVELQLLEADGCRPMAGVPVDIWMASPDGEYSGVDNALVMPGGRVTAGRSFLRGTQRSNADGMVRFRSVFPGWYPVTPPHLHFSVRVEPQRAFTSQFFFADDFAARLYTEAEPYRRRGAHTRRIGWPIPAALVVQPEWLPGPQPEGGLRLRRTLGIRRADLAATCGYGEAGCSNTGLLNGLREAWRVLW